MAEIGVREVTGRNDGARIDEYLRYCGLGPGHAWCAAYVSWCFGQAGYEQPRNPWSPALFPQARRVWEPGTHLPPFSDGQTAPVKPYVHQVGDLFALYDPRLRRIVHVGFIDQWSGSWCITVEGNTGPEGALDTDSPAHPIRAGPEVGAGSGHTAREGVYRKRRPIRTIHAVARWL